MDLDKLGAALFPPGVGFSVADPAKPPIRLMPEEESAVSRSVEKRRTEFAYGRACAREALRAIGSKPVSLPVGPDRAPVWPHEVVGSITHCEGFVAAVAGHKTDFAGLGLDAEPATPLDPELVNLVCLPDEAPRSTVPATPDLGAKLIFCAKEAVFKAVYPNVGVWLEFSDVKLSFVASPERFFVEWVNQDLKKDLPDVARLLGRFMVDENHVFTSAILAR